MQTGNSNPDGAPMGTDTGPGGKPTLKLTPGQTGIYSLDITLVESATPLVYMGLCTYRVNQ